MYSFRLEQYSHPPLVTVKCLLQYSLFIRGQKYHVILGEALFSNMVFS